MPLRQTKYGGECPLGKFIIDIAAGAGCYYVDPLEQCLDCNFADIDQEGFNLEKVCRCPENITWAEYDKLREQYAKTKENHTRSGFWKFVGEKYTFPKK